MIENSRKDGKEPFLLYLDKDQKEWLEKAGEKYGMTQSDVIRRCLDAVWVAEIMGNPLLRRIQKRKNRRR